MFPLDYLLAVVLLTAPPGCPELPYPVEAHPTIRLALLELAVQWEILDSHEVRCLLAQPAHFNCDLETLRRRYRELADAPPLVDCLRFPDRALVHELLSFNRTYRQHLEARQLLERTDRWELQAASREADKLYHIWDAVRDARCGYYYVMVQRRALRRLRELIGEEAYSNGQLPPVVPLWRFQQIDTCTDALPQGRAGSVPFLENSASGAGSKRRPEPFGRRRVAGSQMKSNSSGFYGYQRGDRT